jgi:hypothetical protein
MSTLTKPFSWSFSAYQNFRTCAKRYYHYNVAKDVKEPENDNMRWGFAVHSAMAKRVAHAQPLPDTMPYEKWVDFVLANTDRTQVELGVERKYAITADIKPCEYFDRTVPVWFRAVLDVVKLRVQDHIARIVDWKTGKVPESPIKEEEAMQQLGLSATVLFAHYPDLQAVLMQLVYLQGDVMRERILMRDQLGHFWMTVIPTLAQMQDAQVKQNYPPNPSGLCKKHCAVTSCPHHGRGSF